MTYNTHASDLRPKNWMEIPEPADNEIFLLCDKNSAYDLDLVKFSLTQDFPEDIKTNKRRLKKHEQPTVEVGRMKDEGFIQIEEILPLKRTKGQGFEFQMGHYYYLAETSQILIRIKTYFPLQGIAFQRYLKANTCNTSVVEFVGRMPSAYSQTTSSLKLYGLPSLMFFTLRGENELFSGIGMFNGCRNLRAVSELDTSKMISADYMFSECSELESIPELDFSNIESMQFSFYNCMNLTSISLFNTSKVKYYQESFSGCENLKKISGLNTSNGEYFMLMFRNCFNLADIPKLNIEKAKYLFNMFEGCKVNSHSGLDMGRKSAEIKDVLLNGGYCKMSRCDLPEAAGIWKLVLHETESVSQKLKEQIEIERDIIYRLLATVGAIRVSTDGKLISYNPRKWFAADKRIFRIVNAIISELRRKAEKRAESETMKETADDKQQTTGTRTEPEQADTKQVSTEPPAAKVKTMTKEKAMEKVRKLLALVDGNTTKEEALSALLKAREIMALYNIDNSMTENQRAQANTAKGYDRFDTGICRKSIYDRLVYIIAEAFGCISYIHREGRKYYYFIFGQESFAKVVVEFLKKCIPTMNKLARKATASYGVKTGETGSSAIMNAYIIGFTEGVKDAIQSQSEEIAIVTTDQTKDAFYSIVNPGRARKTRVHVSSNTSSIANAGRRDGSRYMRESGSFAEKNAMRDESGITKKGDIAC